MVTQYIKGDIMLQGKKILLGVTGGIAVYKAVDLASRLKKEGAEIKVIMTENACQFITPLTFRSITHETVTVKAFDAEAEIKHISLADWADLIVIAPATANIIGKIAAGIADDLLSTVVMASTAPKLIVPAMNVHMYENPIVQGNIKQLTNLGYRFMEPEEGILACGYKGKGRFPKPEEIVYHIKSSLHFKLDLSGKHILITAGGCREQIDPMRFIGNYSSGKMGLALARAAQIRGARVTLIMGSTSEKIPPQIRCINVETSADFYREVIKISSDFDVIIMAAAISDFTPATKSEIKIKKADDLQLELIRTKDILAELGTIKPKGQILIGFAAESHNIIENARKKLIKKNLDFIVANSLEVAGKDETEIIIISSDSEKSMQGNKFLIANNILGTIKK